MFFLCAGGSLHLLCGVCSGGSGLTPTEQFLAQVCTPQNARFNGNAFTSSLLQNSGGKADTALICCVACLDSVRLNLSYLRCLTFES